MMKKMKNMVTTAMVSLSLCVPALAYSTDAEAAAAYEQMGAGFAQMAICLVVLYFIFKRKKK